MNWLIYCCATLFSVLMVQLPSILTFPVARTCFRLVISTLALVPAACLGGTLVLSPVQSATIMDENGDGVPEVVGLHSSNPDPGYGIMLVQKNSGTSPYERRAVIEFSLEGIVSVETATLTFSWWNTAKSYAPLFVPLDTLLIDGNGLVQLQDYTSSGISVGQVQLYDTGIASFDITQALKDAIQAGASHIAFRQQLIGTVGGEQTSDPRIVVNSVPEPNSAALFLLGAAMLLPRFNRKFRMSLR